MWHILTLNMVLCLHPTIVRSAWVEIPQVPDNKPAQFFFGSPKVAFLDQKLTTTTPSSHRTGMTTPKLPATTLASYKKVMTTTISPLTTAPQPVNRRIDEGKPEDSAVKPGNKKGKKTNKRTDKKDDFYGGFAPLLRTIQETLTFNARKSLKSKISLLTTLRDNLLFSIDERMSSLWKRSHDENTEARGHDDHEMEFPSNEGALMTIGFLTFAVFLIKLVLKLIHALKNKTTVTTTTTGTAATALIGRRKRSFEDFDDLKILQFIDEFKFG